MTLTLSPFTLIAVAAILALVEIAAYLLYLTPWFAQRRRVLEFLLFRRQPRDRRADHQTDPPRYAEHPFTAWSLNPDFANARGERIHNRHGFRCTLDFERLDHSAPVIYCAGGSSTYCTDIESNHETWPERLREVLTAALERPVQVVNAGVPGFNSFQSYARLSAYIDVVRPDVVAIYHAKNDLTPFYNNTLPDREKVRPDLSNVMRALNFYEMSAALTPLARWSFLARLWAAVRLTGLQSNVLAYAYGLTAAPDIQARLARFYDLSGLQSTQRNLVGLCRSRGVKLVCITQRVRDAVFAPYIQRLNDSIRRLEDRQSGVYVFDFERELPDNPSFFIDKLHFTCKGSEEMGRRTADFLVRARVLGGSPAGSSPSASN